jgi:protein SCO1/2
MNAKLLRFPAAVLILLIMLPAAATLQWRFRPGPVSERHASAARGDDAVSDRSLYQLEAVWTTDRNETLKLVDLRGRYTILALIFTRCSGVCPLLVQQMRVFGASLPADIRSRTRFVAITIDPADTSEILLQYRREMRLDERQWTLLRGESGAVRELAAVLGFNYAPTDDQSDDPQFSHSNLLTLLNPRGEIIHQQPGTGSNLGDLISAIRHDPNAGKVL